MLGQIPEWIAPQGGPYLVLPTEAVVRWDAIAPFGYRGMLPAAPQRNYDEACRLAAKHDIGLIELGDFNGLVLGGCDIPRATWLPRPDGIGGDIVVALEWGFDHRDVNLAAEVASLPDSAFASDGLTFAVESGGLVLFAAAESPPPFYFGHMNCRIAAGTYEIASTQREFGDYLVVRVHRLRGADSIRRGGPA
jgi:hypothetical protein